MRRLIRGLVLASTLGLAGTALAADVSRTYVKKCGSCHGKDGKGQTKMGKKLSVKDYTDPKVQEALTDEQAIKSITEGMKDKAGDELMEPYKEVLSADDIKALVTYLRTFKAK